MSNERPFPQFQPGDSLGPEHAGEIVVVCSLCPDGFVESHPHTSAAFFAWEDHADREHIGSQVRTFDQAWEIVLTRVGPYGDLDTAVERVNDHIRESTKGIEDPAFGLRLLVDACERVQSAAAMIQGEAEGLLSEMPLDKTATGV